LSCLKLVPLLLLSLPLLTTHTHIDSSFIEAVTGYLSQDIQTNWHVPGKSILRHAYPLSRNPVEEAVVVPGPVTDYFCALSKRLGVYIAVPFVEKALNVTEEDNMEDADEFNADNFLFFNTICLVSPKGELVGHYRKNNPWPHPENSWATAGKDPFAFPFLDSYSIYFVKRKRWSDL